MAFIYRASISTCSCCSTRCSRKSTSAARRPSSASRRRRSVTASVVRRLFQDPLFLRTPKGVVTTDRAEHLAAPIADVLMRMQSVVATGTPFDPATSTRRFTLGIPDAAAAMILPSLLSRTRKLAPFIDLSVRQVFPQHALAELEARTIDLAVSPIAAPPARFVAKSIYEEHFVIAARVGDPFLTSPSLLHYRSRTCQPHPTVRGAVRGRERRSAAGAARR